MWHTTPVPHPASPRPLALLFSIVYPKSGAMLLAWLLHSVSAYVWVGWGSSKHGMGRIGDRGDQPLQCTKTLCIILQPFGEALSCSSWLPLSSPDGFLYCGIADPASICTHWFPPGSSSFERRAQKTGEDSLLSKGSHSVFLFGVREVWITGCDLFPLFQASEKFSSSN